MLTAMETDAPETTVEAEAPRSPRHVERFTVSDVLAELLAEEQCWQDCRIKYATTVSKELQDRRLEMNAEISSRVIHYTTKQKIRSTRQQTYMLQYSMKAYFDYVQTMTALSDEWTRGNDVITFSIATLLLCMNSDLNDQITLGDIGCSFASNVCEHKVISTMVRLAQTDTVRLCHRTPFTLLETLIPSGFVHVDKERGVLLRVAQCLLFLSSLCAEYYTWTPAKTACAAAFLACKKTGFTTESMGKLQTDTSFITEVVHLSNEMDRLTKQKASNAEDKFTKCIVQWFNIIVGGNSAKIDTMRMFNYVMA